MPPAPVAPPTADVPPGPAPGRSSGLRRLLARLLAPLAGTWRDRRGTIAIIVAVSAIPLSIASGVAVDMSRMASSRSALQRAVDNAALSGAAAYVLYTQGDSFNAKAQTTARVVFCKAAAVLPAGFALVSSGATACTSTPGAAVSAVIAGYVPGTRGVKAASGCTATNTVVAGVTCGFIVTVSTSATVATIFPFLLGGTAKVSVSASAINPFINLANAIKPNFNGNAGNANSLWVYPLLLDANGAPDFTTNAGALPDASSCTGNPTQTSCGSYTMLASTHFLGCPNNAPQGGCTFNSVTFVNGIVQNPVVGTAVITATTPLGIALQSAAGVDYIQNYGSQVGYYNDTHSSPSPTDKGCSWPAIIAYNTFGQEFDNNGYPLEVDTNGHWTLVTHWLYSSFLANGYPPDYNEILAQGTTQTISAVPTAARSVGYNPTASAAAVACSSPSTGGNGATLTTSYPTTGSTNCALYIVKDPTSLQPNASYKNNSTCFTPSGTPGAQYAALSCQNYAGHNYAFFWNDMSGLVDDTDYGNGTLQIACSGASYVLLIN